MSNIIYCPFLNLLYSNKSKFGNKSSLKNNSLIISQESVQRGNSSEKLQLNNDLESNKEFNVSKVLAESIIRKKTMNKGIYPNHAISTNLNKNTKMEKFGTSMYNPSIVNETLKNFFSVKLV